MEKVVLPVIIGIIFLGFIMTSQDAFALDSDGDGIDDVIDTQPSTVSSNFSDGTTTGFIQNSGDQTLIISDISPDGVNIQSTAGSIPATITICLPSEISITSGDSINVTCNDMILDVISGPIDIILRAEFSPTGTSTGTSILQTGDSIVFNQQTFTFTNNGPNDVTITVNALPIIIAPGEIIPIDSDGDGILENLDNCTVNANPGQEDGDGDGIGTACDGNEVGIFDQISCESNQSTWISPNKCVLPLFEIGGGGGGVTYTFGSDVIVETRNSLANFAADTINVEGTFNIYGISSYNAGVLNNYGIVNVYGIVDPSFSLVNNYGIFNVYGKYGNFGTFNNEGSVVVFDGGRFGNIASDVIFINSGTVYICGGIFNKPIITSSFIGNPIIENCPVIITDDDNDGISDELDLLPTTPSNDFSDGTTFGAITSGNQFLTIIDIPNGVNISSTGIATVDVCGISTLSLSEGDVVDLECGSVTIQVITGSVQLQSPGEPAITLNEGANITIENNFDITNNGPPAIILVNGIERPINSGETITLGTSDPPVCESPFELINGECVDTTPTDPTLLEHYLGYKVKEPKDADKFVKFTVFLDDKYESATYTVEKPDRLFNPVEKNSEEIIDFISHYVGYKIKIPKGDDKFEKIEGVSVTDQFGQLTIDIKKPKLLLVPSTKNHTDIPDILDPVTVNHFKCYDVKESKDTSKFEKLIVTVNDPNFEITQDFEIKKPKMLCVPVDKNGEGLVAEENNLTCYDAKKLKDAPKFEKRNVFTNNQFGPEELKVEKQEELCVPSKILE